MIQQVCFEKVTDGWLITCDGEPVFKKRPTGKMRAIKSLVANLTKGQNKFTLSIETSKEEA